MTPRSRPSSPDSTGGSSGPGDDPQAARPDLDVAKLYAENEPVIRRRMLRVGRQEDAADLTHDAFAKTIASPPGSDSPGGGATYLHTVAGNLLRDRWRRDRRAAAGNVRLAADARLTAAGADSLAIAGIETAAVRVAVASLPQEHQDVLRLRIVDGRTSDEVARMLGREPASVRQIQRRALAQLRKELTAKGWAPDTGMAEEPAPGIIQARKRHEEKQ